MFGKQFVKLNEFFNVSDFRISDPEPAPKGVFKKKCSENTQQIYRRTPMPKCDLNKVAFQLY